MNHPNSSEEFTERTHLKYASSEQSPILRQASLDTLTLATAILKRHYRYNDNLSIATANVDELGKARFAKGSLVIKLDSNLNDARDALSEASTVSLSELRSDDWMVTTIPTNHFLDMPSDQTGQLPEVVFSCCPSQGTLAILFDRDRVDSRDVDYWSSAIRLLLEQLAKRDGATTKVQDLKILDDGLLPSVLERGFNVSPSSPSYFSDTPSPQFTFPTIFESQVERTPNRTAVRSVQTSNKNHGGEPQPPATQFRGTDEHYTYEELNQRSNQIAWWIIDQGIPFQSAIGVHVNRSHAMLAILIGIMKADCFYVPLVPELPATRLAFMIDDADIRCIVTERSLLGSTQQIIDKASSIAPKVLDVDSDDFGQQTQQNSLNPVTVATSDDSAYTIYTSGSTGIPKGVDIRHHSFVNFCHAANEMLDFSEQDTSLAVTTIAFDVSICELYPLLAIGGTVAVAKDKVGADGELFTAAIEQVNASYICATPTSLRILVASGWQNSPDLTIITGGEPISRETCNDLVPRCKRLINGYGPTEATVYTTFGHLTVGEGLVPIGRPVLNLRTYILDGNQRPVPPNVLGELYIGGEALARGYVNRQELTAEKFIPDPFSDQADARMYASGDVCFFDHDGLIMYLGRKDNQVKIRGYRIELGEIETRLKEHPGVTDAVVIVREDTPDEKRLVSYIVGNDSRPTDAELQDFLAETMPDYMVPSWFVDMESFSLNANKKLDRKALPAPEDLQAEPFDTASTTNNLAHDDVGVLAKEIAAVWTKVLGRKIRVDDEVFRMGADSLKAVKFQLELAQIIDVRVPVGEIFQYRTPELLAARIERRTHSRSRRHADQPKASSGSIAVIGMAGRFPGASNLDQYWENLSKGVESINTFTESELEAAGVSALEYRQPNYIPRGTVLDGAYDFEPEVFGITRQDAEILSPQIRLFIQSAFESLENAGYPGEVDGKRIGVYAGTGYPNYLDADFGMVESQRLQTLIGNGPDYVATRTSFALGLTGPAVAIQTACSTSLVTVAEACQALRAGRCEMAIAGGASFSWPAGKGYQHGPGLIYSADGHCRAFDHRATGTLFSQGSGAVVLKPLEHAIADGDTIHAVIEGIATNNDGNRKGGFAAPSIEGQAEVIRMAIDDAGINPEEIGYVEAHGTGTKIGDPIEVAGLTDAWRTYTDKNQFCGIGSVKTNIGHADSAAGIAGLLKVILCLKNRRLTPIRNFEKANPEIDFENSPFFVQTEAEHWESKSKRRIAALSAFGLGGTNAHAIVAEPPTPKEDAAEPVPDSEQTSKPFRVVPFSARTTPSLDRWVSSFQDTCGEHDFSNIVHTLRAGRKPMAKRSFVVARTKDEMLTALASPITPISRTMRRQPVFMFTGQGAQYVNMAIENYSDEPVFRNALDRCCELLADTDVDLKALLYPKANQQKLDINQTFHAQLAIFAVSFAQAQMWMSWGVIPTALVGHSIGEYVAAAIAEVFTLKDAIEIVYQRGRLMQQMDPGSMLAIMRPAGEVEQLIKDFRDIELAVVNSHTVAVVAGPTTQIESLNQSLSASDIKSRILKTSHAFHSKMMEPMLDEFRIALSEVKLSAPKIPVQSNVSGTWMTDDQATSPDYFVSQVRSTVRFVDNIESVLSDDEPKLLLEMGPGRTLTQMAATLFEDDQHVAIATLPTAKVAAEKHAPGAEGFAGDACYASKVALGEVWASGHQFNWDDIESWTTSPKRVPLTGYQFETKTYRADKAATSAVEQDLPEDAWFHVPVWKQLPRGFAKSDSKPEVKSESRVDLREPVGDPVWICFQNAHDSNVSLVPPEKRTITVAAGETFSNDNDRYTIRPESEEDYLTLIDSILASDVSIEGVVHSWSVAPSPSMPTNSDQFWKTLDRSCFSLIWLAKALGQQVVERPIQVKVLTQGTTDGGLCETAINEVHHSLVGTMSVIQKEFPALTTCVVDVGNNLEALTKLPEYSQLLQQNRHYPLIAVANGRFWELAFENVTLDDTPAEQPVFKSGGVYVLTGGLGDLALAMANSWSKEYQDIKFVLLARTGLPERDQWNDATDTKVKSRIESVRKIESSGGTVEIIIADCSVEAQLSGALDSVVARHGKIDGLFHTAGVLRDGIIATKQPTALKEVFASKALAAVHIANWQTQRQAAGLTVANLTVFFSSISADFGMFGQVDYSAANNVLDGLSGRLNAEGLRTVSINWPAFEGVGMAARTEDTAGSQSTLAVELAQNALFAEEGARAVKRIALHSDLERVVVSRKPFEPRRQSAILDGREVVLQQLDSSVASTDEDSPVERMLEIWRDQFGNDEIGIKDDYFKLGGDSLLAVGLIGRIEQTFKKLVPISHLISSPTVVQLCEKLGLVEKAEASLDGSNAPIDGNSSGLQPNPISIFASGLAPEHFVCLREGDPELPPLILVHGADGAVMFYREFATILETSRSIWAIESPFLSNPDHRVGESVEAVGQQYVESLLQFQKRGPFLLAGYSFGGVAAIEMAAQLERAGHEVEQLIIYDIPNPAKVEHSTALERLRGFWAKQDAKTSSIGKTLNLTKRITESVKDRAKFEIENRVSAMKDDSAIDSMFWRHKKSRERHMKMEESYSPPSIQTALKIVIATGNTGKYKYDEQMGWGDVSSEIETTQIPGSHLELFESKHVQAIAQATNQFLNDS